MNDELLIKKTFKLAKKGIGYVSPNPLVGAIIVKNEKIIGSGWHIGFGSHHAEINAIKNARTKNPTISNFHDATLYVNLEPCAHYGKTPPCVDAIIENKFSKVVIAMQDPNPVVAGKGITKLKQAGIEVVLGICENEAKFLNRFFIKYITEKKPYTILKIAQSIDGCIATSTGESQWISGEESRRRVHQLRSEVDAILIGKNTALADNPRLNVREVSGKDPKRIVLDTNLTLPIKLNLFQDENFLNTIICCSNKAAKSEKAIKFKDIGIEILSVNTTNDSKLDLDEILIQLGSKYGISSIMVEGGSSIYSAFARENLIDELRVFIAPKIIGNGLYAFGNFNINLLNEAVQLKLHSIEYAGNDIDCRFIGL